MQVWVCNIFLESVSRYSYIRLSKPIMKFEKKKWLYLDCLTLCALQFLSLVGRELWTDRWYSTSVIHDVATHGQNHSINELQSHFSNTLLCNVFFNSSSVFSTLSCRVHPRYFRHPSFRKSSGSVFSHLPNSSIQATLISGSRSR